MSKAGKDRITQTQSGCSPGKLIRKSERAQADLKLDERMVQGIFILTSLSTEGSRETLTVPAVLFPQGVFDVQSCAWSPELSGAFSGTRLFQSPLLTEIKAARSQCSHCELLQ